MNSASRPQPSIAPAPSRKAFYYYVASVLIALTLSAVFVWVVTQAAELSIAMHRP